MVATLEAVRKVADYCMVLGSFQKVKVNKNKGKTVEQ
tara:strand:- start:137 stop:247 length:111 start_codon:yes stop_codon:yes gene_type:complete